MNKKGAEMTIGTIIIIVLALIVLVVLVVGFTGGWSNLWGKITAFFGGGTNVDTIVQACQLACTSNSKYDYCDKIRTLKFEDAEKKLRKVDLSCNILEENKGKPAKDTNAQDVALPSVELSCEITCPPASATKTCIEQEGNWKSTCDANTEEIVSQTKDTKTGEKCCRVKS